MLTFSRLSTWVVLPRELLMYVLSPGFGQSSSSLLQTGFRYLSSLRGIYFASEQLEQNAKSWTRLKP